MNKLASQLAYIVSSNNEEYKSLFEEFAENFVSENDDNQFKILNDRITKNCKENKLFVRNLALILAKFYNIELPDSLLNNQNTHEPEPCFCRLCSIYYLFYSGIRLWIYHLS